MSKIEFSIDFSNKSKATNANEIPVGFFYGSISNYGPGLFFRSAHDITMLNKIDSRGSLMNWGYGLKNNIPDLVDNYRPVDVFIEVK